MELEHKIGIQFFLIFSRIDRAEQMKLEKNPEKLKTRSVLGCNVNGCFTTVLSSSMKVKMTNGTWLEGLCFIVMSS